MTYQKDHMINFNNKQIKKNKEILRLWKENCIKDYNINMDLSNNYNINKNTKVNKLNKLKELKTKALNN